MHLRLYRGIDDVASPSEITNPTLPSTADMTEEKWLGQFIPLHYHYNMLQDMDRVCAFRDAIALTVKPGMHVLELGSGTGILSSFAARMGAQVTAVERNPALVKASQDFLKINGLQDRVQVVHADALAYLPTTPVDVVICEMLHVALAREKQMDVIASFKRRYQRTIESKLPQFLPEASVLLVQPVEHNFDFEGYWAPIPMFHAPLAQQPRTTELAQLAIYANIDYADPFQCRFEWSGQFTMQQSGHYNALRFITQNVVTIDSATNQPVLWPNQCLIMPIAEPCDVIAGHTHEISLKYQAGQSLEALSAGISTMRRPLANAA